MFHFGGITAKLVISFGIFAPPGVKTSSIPQEVIGGKAGKL